jgi:hypothetical protein
MATTPGQIFDRVVEPLSGDALNASSYKLIASGILDSAVTADPINQGRVIHQHTATVGSDFADPTKYRPTKGFRPGAVSNQIPYLVTRGTLDLDSQGVVDASYHGYAGMTGSQKLITGVCHLDSCEVATREFDTAQTYLVNEPLRAVRDDANATTAGRITNQGITWGTTNICGQVTNGKTINVYGKDVLHMITMYVRGSEAAS